MTRWFRCRCEACTRAALRRAVPLDRAKLTALVTRRPSPQPVSYGTMGAPANQAR